MQRNYYDYNDYELLSYAAEQNEIAYDILISKYEPYIITFAHKVYTQTEASQYGLEVSDLIQMGKYGLTKAIETYDESQNAKFFTYAKVCIERHILNAITRSQVKRNQILNDSIPLYYEDGTQISGTEKEFYVKNNPEEIIVQLELEQYVRTQLQSLLTDLETNVLKMKMEGYSYRQISKELGISMKSSENAMQRVRNKARNLHLEL